MTPELKRLLEKHNKIYKVRRPFSPSIENIISKVREQTGLDKDSIYQIISSQFRMIQETIYDSSDKSGLDTLAFENYKSIRLIYLGTFEPSKNKFNRVVKLLKKKDV